MKSANVARNPKIVVPILLLLLLACGPVDQLFEYNQSSRAVATGVAIINAGDYPALDAYQKLRRLPGYRLTSQQITKNNTEVIATTVITRQFDPAGNSYAIAIMPNSNHPIESYTINGQTYSFVEAYNGWVAQPENPSADPFSSATQIELPIQLLAQFGAVPVETGQETIQARPATRYELRYVAAELAEALNKQPASSAADLKGALWVDNETGALLKSEIQFFQDGSKHPQYKFLLEVSQIGNISTIIPPEPVVNPNQIVAATATAQAWSALPVEFNFEGQSISFQIVPMQIMQGASRAEAQMQLDLIGLPVDILRRPETFLSQLGTQIKLSIPQNNLTATAGKFQVGDVNLQNQSLGVTYNFEADLQGFNHVELILSSPGNPLFTLVPVVESK